VLRHLTKGLSNEQLALELGVTVRTVKYYLSQIFRKLRVRSRIEAIVKAQKIGLN
jgi:DNA-binding NarL/FixJ family response regulator